jgi:molybdate transport system permease protein
VRRAAAAALVFLATFVALAFLALPVAAIFGRVPPGKLVAQLGNLVLPPAVAGIGLLAAFGRTGLLHTSIPFTQTAVVLAVSFVASPLYVRAAIAAFEGIDANLVAASRTLGAGPVRTFFRVVLPLARGGLSAGAALAFARGLGEFGATIMFAGSLRGVTQTLPLAVYAEFDVNFDVALAVSALLVVISAALLVTLKWLPSASTSRIRFATSS